MEGLAAYDGGDYYAAYLAWLPLAKSGDGGAQAAIADLYHARLLGGVGGATAVRRNDRIERIVVDRTYDQLRESALNFKNGADQRGSALAAWWYEQAARCGHAIAQLNLGDFYVRGIGVEPDPVRAYLWLGLAARQGRDWAKGRQDQIAAGMTVEQIEEGQGLIAEWRPEPACPG